MADLYNEKLERRRKLGLVAPKDEGFLGEGIDRFQGHFISGMRGIGATVNELGGGSGMQNYFDDVLAVNRQWEQPENLSASGYIGGAIGGGAGSTAVIIPGTIAGAAVGTAVHPGGGTIGGAIGGGLVAFSQSFGNNVQRNRELFGERFSEEKIMALAAGESSIDAAIEVALGTVPALGKTFQSLTATGKKTLAIELLNKSAKEMGKAQAGKYWLRVAKSALSNGKEEAVEEALQYVNSFLWQAMAGNKDATFSMAELTDNMTQGFIGGTALGGVNSLYSERNISAPPIGIPDTHVSRMEPSAVATPGENAIATPVDVPNSEIPVSARLTEAVAKELGLKVRYFDEEGAPAPVDGNGNQVNGWYDDQAGEFWIDRTGANRNPLENLGHEFKHFVAKRHPDLTPTFDALFESGLNEAGKNELQETENVYSDAGYSAGQGKVEFNADTFGKLWTEPDFWKDVAARAEQKEAGMGMKFLEALKDFFQMIRSKLKAIGTDDAKLLFDNMGELRDSAVELLAEYKRRNGSSTEVENVVGVQGHTEVQSIPVTDLSVDPARFQFKSKANKVTGVDESNQIGGQWDAKTAGNLYVWEAKNGKKFVVNGHHRFQLAQQSQVENVNAIVDREVDGVTAEQARRNGVLINIRDEQGEVKDYAEFVRSEKMDEKTAQAEGILAREKGRTGYLIGKYAGDNLFVRFNADEITGVKAATIADIARGEEAIEAAGIRAATTMPNAQLREFLKLLKNTPREKNEQGDLFGFDDSALRTAEVLSKLASRHIREIGDKLRAVKQAVKNPDTAAKGDVKVGKNAQKLYDQTLRELAAWDNWSSDPELYRQLVQEAGLAPATAQVESEKETFPQNAEPQVAGKLDAGRFDPASETPLLSAEEDVNDFQLFSETADEVRERNNQEKKAEQVRHERAQRKAAQESPDLLPKQNIAKTLIELPDGTHEIDGVKFSKQNNIFQPIGNTDRLSARGLERLIKQHQAVDKVNQEEYSNSETKEMDHAASTATHLERGGEGRSVANATDAKAVRDDGRGNQPVSRPGVDAPQDARIQLQGSRNHADAAPELVGAGSRVVDDRPLPGDRAGTAGREQLVGSDANRAGRTQSPALADGRNTDHPATEKTARRAPESASSVKRENRDNIAATLPALYPAQHDDVFKAEKRFHSHKGMLFTNATGTGKTFTGLGVIKRFVLEGKGNILIVTPTDKKNLDWVADAQNLQLSVTPLSGVNDHGSGIVVTTYANFRQNDSLMRRNWDLLVFDESHKISSAEGDVDTLAKQQLDRLAGVRDIAFHRAVSENLPEVKTALTAQDKSFANYLLAPAEDSDKPVLRPDNVTPERFKEFPEKLRKKLKDREVELSKSKVLFLSATPFAYHKSLLYADGYLFDIPREREDGSRGYNQPDPQERFFVENFGYRMRYNKLTRPDSDVDIGVMERAFYEKLRKSGAVSGRMLDIDKDYSREFFTVKSELGEKIQAGMDIVNDYKIYPAISTLIHKMYDYNYITGLLESLKTKDSVEEIKQNLALGRKVVVFHNRNTGHPVHPFQLGKLLSFAQNDTQQDTLREEIAKFEREHPELVNLRLNDLANPLVALRRAFGDKALFFDGTVPKKERSRNVELFNDAQSGYDILVVQTEAGKEGISLHDKKGDKQRVIINLGLPTKPTDLIQSEGRIFRLGSQSNAIFRYPVTGLPMERWAFGSKINQRASTAENLGMGEAARNLRDSLREGYNNASELSPGEYQGTGGKDADRNFQEISEFERAKTYYFGNQKKTSRSKSIEGIDYFATPEPIGMKMVEWANLKPGERVLEPSAGHGAIARFFPDTVDARAIEPSGELSSRLTVNTTAKVIRSNFEEHSPVNKYDSIIMNPPFGVGGKTAIEHLARAFNRHLDGRGRIVALLPDGGMAEKRLSAWLLAQEDAYLTADIGLPQVTFSRTGTSVKTHIVIIDKAPRWMAAQVPQPQSRIDLESDNINELFDRIENLSVPERADDSRNYSLVRDHAEYAIDPELRREAKRKIIEWWNDPDLGDGRDESINIGHFSPEVIRVLNDKFGFKKINADSLIELKRISLQHIKRSHPDLALDQICQIVDTFDSPTDVGYSFGKVDGHRLWFFRELPSGTTLGISIFGGHRNRGNIKTFFDVKKSKKEYIKDKGIHLETVATSAERSFDGPGAIPERSSSMPLSDNSIAQKGGFVKPETEKDYSLVRHQQRNPIRDAGAIQDQYQNMLNTEAYLPKKNAVLNEQAARHIANIGGINSVIRGILDGDFGIGSDIAQRATQVVLNSMEYQNLSADDRATIADAYIKAGYNAGSALAARRLGLLDMNDIQSIQAHVNALVAKIDKSNPKNNLRQTILDAFGFDIDNLPEELENNPKELDRLLRTLAAQRAGKFDKAYEWWINSILSAPTTHMANTVGNTANAVYELGIKRLAEAAINVAARRKDAATFGEFKAMTGAFDWKNAWERAKSAFDLETLTPEGKVEQLRTAIGGKFGRTVRVPGRFLRAADEFAKTLVAPVEATAFAYREGKANRLHGQDLKTYVTQQVSLNNSAATQYGRQRALELTFQEDPGTAVAQLIQWREAGGVAGTLLKFVLPFVKTPHNIVRQGVRKSPVGALSLAWETGKGLLGKRQFDNDYVQRVAEQVVAWGTVAFFLSMDDDDDRPFLTGSSARYGSAEANFKANKIPPYSIRIGENYYSYKRIEPLATGLAFIADGLNALKMANNGVDGTRVTKRLLEGMKQLVVEKSFLDSLGEINRVASDPERSLSQFGTNFLASWMPNVVQQSLKLYDDNVRDYKSKERGLEWLEDQFWVIPNRIGVTKAAPKIDYFGREIPKDSLADAGALWPLMRMIPIQSVKSDDNMNKVEELIWRYNQAHPDAEYYPDVPAYYFQREGKRLYFSGENYEEFAREAGQLALKQINNAFRHGLLNVNNPKERDIDLIKQIFSRSRQVIRDRMYRSKKYAE